MTAANAHDINVNTGIVGVDEEKAYVDEKVAELSSPADAGNERGLRRAGELEKQPMPLVPDMGWSEKPVAEENIPTASELQTQPPAYEMSAVASATNVGSEWEYPQAAELASEPATHHPYPGPPVGAELLASSQTPSTAVSPTSTTALSEFGSPSFSTAMPSWSTALPASECGSSGGDEKLDILRQRIDRVREDKGRLEKIQQLKDLEAELQREIMAEQRRMGGGV
jgi:hypothetical protein